MIKVENLSKFYGNTQALKEISFKVNQGEIFGFLGPNGAGKTTTMRILSCYFPPSSGKVEVNGVDVCQDPLEVKRKIGYMPENAPLYPEMRVDEYLKFKGGLKSIRGKFLSSAIERVVENCDLTPVINRICGQLSRGYRQRVVLADTLLADPSVLILDEPSVGLDPNQIIKVRNLLKNLAQNKTIILSTHILPEAEAICQRILIINQGRIIVQEQAKKLRQTLKLGSQIRLEMRCEPKSATTELRNILGPKSVKEGIPLKTHDQPDNLYLFLLKKQEGFLDDSHWGEKLFHLAVSNNWVIREMKREKGGLEDLFVQITEKNNLPQS